MENLRTLFENEYPGKKVLFESLIKPIFVKANDTTLTDEQELSDSDKKQIKSFRIIAQVRGSFPITFADIELQDNVALKRSRVNIQNCVRKVMENDSNALIFFHFTDNAKEWRVSYVNKADSLKNSTSAKRYTYLCGPEHSCRTIAERFSTLEGLSTIKDENMLEAFAVAPLSDDFFNEYRKHYADLVEYISGKRFIKKGGKFVEEKTKKAASEFANAFNGDDKAVRDFVKKMLGRLVFLQFLQKKGWLGVPKNAKWGTGDKNFIYNLFTNADDSVKNDFLEQALEPLFFKSLNCDRGEEAIAPKAVCNIYRSEIRIPYLNGGLFEEDELDKKRVKFKKEHFESIFEFFNQYNFTIDETDTDDVEIGVDPEMLGKIFENLLEDNKDKGAFYTPKEIVQYMCRESLIAYLETETVKHEETASKDKIRNFVLNHEASSFSEKEKADILKALIDVKICDPAVGSGAFPMGMLNELLPCVQILTGEAKTRVELKKHIVKNNIYGVDIEKGAVDIARLRFWLAIIVDEEEPLPLPNLDYKIMQGNSLLESFEGIDLSDLTTKKVDELFDDADDEKCLVTTLQKYFDTSDHNAKIAHREAIKSAVLDLLEKRGISTAENKVKTDLSKLDLHENTQFFLWHTWFYDVFNRPNDCNGRNGFDIVIGNPPYKIISKYDSKKSIYDKNFIVAHGGKRNLYHLFFEQGINLLHDNSILSYITPDTYFSGNDTESLREFFVKNCEIKSIVHYTEKDKVFENVTQAVAVCIMKKNISKNCIFHIFEKDSYNQISYSALNKENKFIFKSENIIITKMKKCKNTFDDICEAYKGDVNLGLKKNFFTNKKSKNTLPLIRGVQISKYIWSPGSEYCSLTALSKNHTDKERIVFQEVANMGLKQRTKGTILKNIIAGDSCNVLFSTNENFPNKYILAILNSKAINYYFKYFNQTNHVPIGEVRKFPIPSATPIQQQQIIALVDKILAAKKDCRIKHENDSELADTSTLEMQIDELVYDLYGLTGDEIKIIEEN